MVEGRDGKVSSREVYRIEKTLLKRTCSGESTALHSESLLDLLGSDIFRGADR